MGAFVAIGVFDGVHLGHQKILDEMVAEAAAAGVESVALTFDPHPDSVLRPAEAPPLLTELEERVRLIKSRGVRTVAVLPFDRDLAAMSAEDFLEGVLCPRFRPRRLFVGSNFTFGRGGRGTTALLEEAGPRLGFAVRAFTPVTLDGEVVSSTLIRQRIQAGAVEWAARALGRPYALRGKVVRGDGRGKQLGFPTANLEVPRGLCLPAPGVYAVLVDPGRDGWPGGGPCAGVANVGVRPTFGDGGRVTLEVHVMDFAGDLYGLPLAVHFVARLRGERRFNSPGALADQIRGDVAAARAMLKVRC